MRRFSILAALALVVALAAPALAQQSIAVFSLASISERCDKIQAERQKLEKAFAADRANLQQLEGAIRKKEEELRVQAGALTLDAQENRQGELARLRIDFTTAERTLARKAQEENARIREEFLPLVNEAIKNYAEKNKLDMVLESSMVVMYSTPQVDITEPLLLEVNARWKAQGSK